MSAVNKSGLTLYPDKTRLVPFGRSDRSEKDDGSQAVNLRHRPWGVIRAATLAQRVPVFRSW